MSATESRVLTAKDREVRGYSWPPFEAGNRAALKHGAFSQQLREEATKEISPLILEAAPWLDRPEYALTIDRYLRTEAAALVTFRAIETIVTTRGAEHVPRKLWQAWNAATNSASKQAALLGLDPTSRERIAAARRFDHQEALERLSAVGRATRAAQGREQ